MMIRVYIAMAVFLGCMDGAALADDGLSSGNRRARRAYERAMEAWRLYDHQAALYELERATERDPDFLEAHLMMGEIHYSRGDYGASIAPYRRVVELDDRFFPAARYYLGRALYRTGNYVESVEVLTLLLQLNGVGEDLQARAADIKGRAIFACEAVNNPVSFEAVNAGAAINSQHAEYSPSLTADEQSLVFTRKKPRFPGATDLQRDFYEDFYISHRRDGEWTTAVNMGAPLNTADNEGAQSLTADGRHMYFTACNRPDGMGSCDIYHARREGDTWSRPRNIGPPVNSRAWESQPSISADGNTLYFASNREGSIGPMDIWKSTRGDDGTWSSPVNLGEPVNTTGHEMSPFIHHDGRSLYFASDGHKGMGGLDLFVSRLGEDGRWTPPENIGYPINTVGDEFAMVVGASGRRAWFASDMEGGYGRTDLYTFELHEEVQPHPHTFMRGIVYDAESGEPLAARIELIGLDTNHLITSSLSDPVKGDFLVAIPMDKDLALNVSKEGYLFFSEHFSHSGLRSPADPYLHDIGLEAIREGRAVVLRNIFFETDSYALHESSHAELEKLVHFLRDNPGLEVEISGHTDSTGSFDHNLRLSQNRAASVHRYLVEQGVPGGRLSYRGYADTQPVDTNETPEGRARNRRTEFRVIGGGP